jgi:hypothetical protein
MQSISIISHHPMLDDTDEKRICSKRKIQEFEIYSHDVKIDVIYQLIEKEWQNGLITQKI